KVPGVLTKRVVHDDTHTQVCKVITIDKIRTLDLFIRFLIFGGIFIQMNLIAYHSIGKRIELKT
ncbi:MAG: hypothetical protein PWP64_1350, partial [Candidatus Cloacimonadota bacterium]|nr:hypothetical protein [Candidatus Cloacimonadota bacterium]